MRIYPPARGVACAPQPPNWFTGAHARRNSLAARRVRGPRELRRVLATPHTSISIIDNDTVYELRELALVAVVVGTSVCAYAQHEVRELQSAALCCIVVGYEWGTPLIVVRCCYAGYVVRIGSHRMRGGGDECA